MNGNIKYLVFGVCATLVLLGAFVVMASATTEQVRGGESIRMAVDAAVPFRNDATSSHRIPRNRAMLFEDGVPPSHEKRILFDKHPISEYRLNEQIIRAAETQKSNYTFSLHGDVRLLWSYVNDEKDAWVYSVILGDVNGDDITDVLVSDCCEDFFTSDCDSENKLFAISGKDGSTIWSRNY